jgi:hypothetical protein
MMEALSSSEMSVLTKPHGVKSQKTAFFIVTDMKTRKSYILLTQFANQLLSLSRCSALADKTPPIAVSEY